jgi:hypothetical protein
MLVEVRRARHTLASWCIVVADTKARIIPDHSQVFKYRILYEPYVGLKVENKKRTTPSFQNLAMLVAFYTKTADTLASVLKTPCPIRMTVAIPKFV